MTSKTIAAICAHPDDVEFLCAGALIHLARCGCAIHIATMTAGDKGTVTHSRAEIGRIRTTEAAQSASLIGATYHCLGFEDMYITYGRESLNRTTAFLREIKPDVVFTNSPADYMIDHETTSHIVQSACFACGIKNMECEGEPFEPVPCLYYLDAMDGVNILGEPVVPMMGVDISTVMEMKRQMLGCHESQRAWLLAHHGMDEYIEAMNRFAANRGALFGVAQAEGFRQHLGHCYPHENALAQLLGDKLIMKKA